MKNVLIGALAGAILGALCFGSIAAATPGEWSTLESSVIGLWIGLGLGVVFGGMANV